MNKKLKIHDGDTPGKVFEVKLEYPKPKVVQMENNKLVCPFCNLDIRSHRIYLDGCDNTRSPLWQELIKLREENERTRKALDVALDWLEQVATPEKCDDDLCREFTKRKLAEIKTALEQKE